MRAKEFIAEQWSQKYKKSINCSHPKGFSQKAHCAGKKKHNESVEMEMTCPDCNMCESHGNLNEIKKGQKDSNGYTSCWSGYHAAGTKKGKNGKQVRNCVANENINEFARSDDDRGGPGDDPYKYPKPDHYNRSIDYFGRFEADHFDQEDFNDATGVFKGYWGATQIAYFKFDDPQHNGSDDPGMGWYYEPQNENAESAKEFDLIESIIEGLANYNQVDAEEIWEDLDTLTDDELYVFAVTQELVTEDWQKANKQDKTDGMSQKAVNAYRRENPGSKLKTAVTTKPSKLKKGGKASKRRSSYCSRSKGQMNMHNISCAKTPDKAICKARRRWNC